MLPAPATIVEYTPPPPPRAVDQEKTPRLMDAMDALQKKGEKIEVDTCLPPIRRDLKKTTLQNLRLRRYLVKLGTQRIRDKGNQDQGTLQNKRRG